jgi:hypothetical protein
MASCREDKLDRADSRTSDEKGSPVPTPEIISLARVVFSILLPILLTQSRQH